MEILLSIAIGCALVFGALGVLSRRGGAGAGSGGESRAPSRYPYRTEVERRLPNGRITTNGYAARHPGQFTHWARGPENVYGECIDRRDWEEWRANYYGE